MNRKIIAAGHICLDITPVFPENLAVNAPEDILIPGKLINTQSADVHTGGSVANTGLALKMLGNDAELLGKVGDDAFGALVKQILASYGAGGLLTDSDSSTSYSVVLALPGIDRIFLHSPGANDSFCGNDIPDSALDDAALFHFGYPPLMKKIYENDGAELAEIFNRVKAKGIATSLDFAAVDPNSEAGAVNWEKLLQNVLPYTDFFVPSFEELCFMLDREKYLSFGDDIIGKLDISRDAKPLAEKCLALGCKAVLIKCGMAGLYFLAGEMNGVGEKLGLNVSEWKNAEIIQPCFRAERVISATGAGDTCIAAFLTALLRGMAPENCVALAAAEGACAVTSYDALSGLKSLEELEAKIAAGWAYN